MLNWIKSAFIRKEVEDGKRKVNVSFKEEAIFSLEVKEYTNRKKDRVKLITASGGNNNLLGYLGYQCHHTGEQEDWKKYLELIDEETHQKVKHICNDNFKR